MRIKYTVVLLQFLTSFLWSVIAIDDGQFAKYYFNSENDICSTVYGFKVSNQLV